MIFPHLSTLMGQVNEPVNKFIHHILPVSRRKPRQIWSGNLVAAIFLQADELWNRATKNSSETRIRDPVLKKRVEEGEEQKLGNLLKREQSS